MDKILVWYDQEEVKESKNTTLYLAMEGVRGTVTLTSTGWKLCLYLSEQDADKLAFVINSNLQTIALARKEPNG